MYNYFHLLMNHVKVHEWIETFVGGRANVVDYSCLSSY
jgi:hypothetical protein